MLCRPYVVSERGERASRAVRAAPISVHQVAPRRAPHWSVLKRVVGIAVGHRLRRLAQGPVEASIAPVAAVVLALAEVGSSTELLDATQGIGEAPPHMTCVTKMSAAGNCYADNRRGSAKLISQHRVRTGM